MGNSKNKYHSVIFTKNGQDDGKHSTKLEGEIGGRI